MLLQWTQMLTSQISNPPLWTFFVECWVECGSTSLPWQCYGNSFHPVGMLLSQYTLLVKVKAAIHSLLLLTITMTTIIIITCTWVSQTTCVSLTYFPHWADLAVWVQRVMTMVQHLLVILAGCQSKFQLVQQNNVLPQLVEVLDHLLGWHRVELWWTHSNTDVNGMQRPQLCWSTQ